MIMRWRKAHVEAFHLALYITVKRLYVKGRMLDFGFRPLSGLFQSLCIRNDSLFQFNEMRSIS